MKNPCVCVDFFLTINSCEANAFNKPRSLEKTKKSYVHDNVLEAVLTYFSTGVIDPSQKVYQTGLAPIYFQHPGDTLTFCSQLLPANAGFAGHSLCIVGLEIRKNGNMNLLVFDPMFKTAPGISRLVGAKFHAPQPDKLLKAYRRGDTYLGKYNSFEILKYVGRRSGLYHLPTSRLMAPGARYRGGAEPFSSEQRSQQAVADSNRPC